MKYLEVPDIHYSPSWGDVTEQAINAVAKAARDNAVDFIAIPGDIYDRPIMTSDKGGINHLRRMIRKLTSICPVVAVYGTPSHEAPGSLEPLTDVGLTVLEPGKVYGHFVDTVREIKGAPIQEPELILFGVPELSKKTIQSQLSLTADEANAEAVNLFRQYITEFVAPHRAKYPDIPAVMLLHGNVSDSSRDNETNIILRASDIVIHTDDIRPANLDRVSLGHIHTPWESSVISAGYAGYTGIDSNPWGKTGFVPSMNLVEIQDAVELQEDFRPTTSRAVSIARIPYGTPERRKIIRTLSEYDPAVAYWLHTDDHTATLPDDVHPWSRVTHDEARSETRRVTREQADTVKTLSDLFRLIDPAVTEPIINKVDTMESEFGIKQHDPVDVRVESIDVQGCIFFDGRTAHLDINGLEPGINALRGDNGSGKSSILSFATPYPVIVGKDTSSGRSSAIKDFFDDPESKIVKRLNCNGKRHDHVITVRGAHTKSPKTECYLSIDGEPQLDKGTFDEMFTMCEQLYGPFADYLLTTFYVQPLQGNQKSGLMSATMTDIRDLVQSIAGIDREQEKRHALDQVSVIGKEIERLESWLTGAREFAVDIDELERQRKDITDRITALKTELQEHERTGKEKNQAYEQAVENKRQSDDESRRKQEDESRSFEILGTISKLKNELESLNKAAGELAQNESLIKADDQARDTRNRNREERQKREDEIRTITRRNEDALRQHEQRKSELETKITRDKQQVESMRERITSIEVACPNCGYIDPDAMRKSAEIRESIAVLEKLIGENETAQSELTHPVTEPVPPAIETVDPDIMSDDDRTQIMDRIDSGRRASARIPVIDEQISSLEIEHEKLKSRQYHIDEQAEQEVQRTRKELEDTREKYRAVSSDIAREEERERSIAQQIERAREVSGKIAQAEADIKQHTADRTDWDYIARMLQPSKIPALELELVLDSIDAEATRVIAPFQEDRYAFRTETQQQGKAGTVDRFDIRIHDNERGTDKSFLVLNPGHKAFFADAYTKALVRQRNERAQRRYDPVVMDESDGPIQPERIAAYYEIQRQYWTDSRVLVVSHSPASHEHIENMISMEEILG